jgi:hypothetical protein
MDSNFVTPNSSMGANIHATGGAFDEGRFHPVHSPFRPRILLPTTAKTPTPAARRSRLPSHPSPLRPNKDEDDDDDDHYALALPTDHTVASNLEPFPCDMMDDVCLNLEDDVEDDWSHQHSHGGITSVARKESWKSPSSWNTPDQRSYQKQQHRHHQEKADSEHRLRLFQERLVGLQESFRIMILSAQETDQGPLLSVLCHWAKQVAQAPLSNPKTSFDTKRGASFPLKSCTTASV